MKLKSKILLMLVAITFFACTSSESKNKLKVEKALQKQTEKDLNKEGTKAKKEEASVYSKKIDMNRYPNANIFVLLDKREIKLEEDDTLDIKRRVVKKIINYAGKKDHSEFKIDYDKRYEKVEILEAVTIKTDGKRVELPKEDIKVLDSPDDYQKKDFAVEKRLIVPFQSVEKGDILDLTYKITSDKKEKRTDYITFASEDPVLDMSITLNYPKSKEVSLTKKNWEEDIEESITKKNNRVIHTLKKENLKQILPERNMVDRSEIFPTIYMTTYKNWDEYKKEVYNLAKDHYDPEDSVKELLEKIDISADTKYGKVKEIKNYLAKNIKLITVNDLDKFKIRDMETVIKKGYGNSYERALLFKQLLDLEDIENNLVIIGMKENKFTDKKELLLVDNFNYVINKLSIEEKNYFIDSSSEFYDLDELGYENLVGFTVGKDSDFIKVDGASTNMRYYKLEGELDRNLNLKMAIKKDYSGNEEARLRRKYKYMTPTDKRIDFQQELGDISLQIQPLTNGFILDLGKDVSKSFKYREMGFAVKTGEFIYFDIPVNLNYMRLIYDAKQRKYPFENRDEYRRDLTFELDIPTGLELVEGPCDILIENDIMKVKRRIKVENNKIIIADRFILKEGVIEIDEYGKFYEDVNKLSKKENRRFLFKIK